MESITVTVDDAAPRRDGREVERVFGVLVEEIVSGAIAPGAKLSEPDLARRFGISRGPLREAIRRLQERELVLCTPNAGARVSVHTPEEILEVYQIREALEGMAARLAAQNMTTEEIVQLRGTFEEETARRKSASYRNDFHMQIVRGSHSARLCRLLNEDYYQLLKLWRTNCNWLRYGSDESWRDHQRILEAIEYRDGECAEILMRRHIARLREDSIRNLRDLGVSVTRG
ncbi:GntR family transcriptional regulator [Microvirga arabica]|uniref:GntR family transcriptional regulator n=1 Tax=Microvirga arabica TaxID=1128671 RepID=A0ABV6YBG9_9HYPH